MTSSGCVRFYILVCINIKKHKSFLILYVEHSCNKTKQDKCTFLDISNGDVNLRVSKGFFMLHCVVFMCAGVTSVPQ